MIKLNDEYSIDFDPYNLKLCRDVVNKKTGESYRKSCWLLWRFYSLS